MCYCHGKVTQIEDALCGRYECGSIFLTPMCHSKKCVHCTTIRKKLDKLDDELEMEARGEVNLTKHGYGHVIATDGEFDGIYCKCGKLTELDDYWDQCYCPETGVWMEEPYTKDVGLRPTRREIK